MPACLLVGHQSHLKRAETNGIYGWAPRDIRQERGRTSKENLAIVEWLRPFPTSSLSRRKFSVFKLKFIIRGPGQRQGHLPGLTCLGMPERFSLFNRSCQQSRKLPSSGGSVRSSGLLHETKQQNKLRKKIALTLERMWVKVINHSFRIRFQLSSRCCKREDTCQ